MVRKVLAFFRRIIVYIFSTPFLRRLKKHSPGLYFFLAARFSIRRFSGMPLTLLVVALAGNLLMMLDVYSDILNSKEFVSIDNTVAETVFAMRTDFSAKIFYAITQLGHQYVILGGMVLLSVIFIVRKEGHHVAGLLISVLGSALTVQVGKYIFKINRPTQYSYYPMDSFSFPSGHATAVVAFYGIVFYALIRDAKRLKVKFILLVSWLLLVLLIGFSRIYLCEHFVSDVVGGYLLGLLWLLLSISIVLWRDDQRRRAKRVA